MIVKCLHCEARIKVLDSAFVNGTPTVLCPACKQQFRPEMPVQKPTGQAGVDNSIKEKEPTEVGWLVVHDENTPQQTYALKLGKQTIGRKSASRPCDIMIETTDEYMSRRHFIIEVITRSPGNYEYYLSDNNAVNKTFINTKKLCEIKRGDEYILHDGDTIQAGRTKIVFKSNRFVKNSRQATEIVVEQPKGKTVLV